MNQNITSQIEYIKLINNENDNDDKDGILLKLKERLEKIMEDHQRETETIMPIENNECGDIVNGNYVCLFSILKSLCLLVNL